jgi:hypothetical protein
MRGELERIARAGGADTAAVLAELAERDVIAFGQAGEIRAAYPFSPTPTPIEVSWKGGPVTYAMCAIDALGMSAMLGRPVTITAAEPGTGRVVTVHADRDRARWDPRRAAVFAGATGGDCCHAADRTCGYINFFTSAPAARTWAHAKPCRHRDGPETSAGAAQRRRGVRGLHADRRRHHPALTSPDHGTRRPGHGRADMPSRSAEAQARRVQSRGSLCGGIRNLGPGDAAVVPELEGCRWQGVSADQLPRRGGGPRLGIIMPAHIGRDELAALTGQGAQLVEVLPAGDYGWAHLPGSVNLPLKELDARAGELDRSRPVIVYCHDWY